MTQSWPAITHDIDYREGGLRLSGPETQYLLFWAWVVRRLPFRSIAGMAVRVNGNDHVPRTRTLFVISTPFTREFPRFIHWNPEATVV